MTGPTIIAVMFPLLLVVITCQVDDLITSGATLVMDPEKVGTDFRCLQYMCLQSNQPLCRGCFWFSDCLGDKKCVTKWCGDTNFFKELQLSPCCQDFSLISQHRCCMIDGGKRAILVRMENATSEDSFGLDLNDANQAKCQFLEHGLTVTIRHCEISFPTTTTTTTVSKPVVMTDKKLPSISGGNTIHQSIDLILVVCLSVFMTIF